MSPQRDLRPRLDPIVESLGRILASAPFARSARMRRFLRFAVEESLAGRSGRLKEYVIGVEVFDRGDSFDPRADPIVRVEARRLRAKLQQYYDGEGRTDAIRIEIPAGSYAPRFMPVDPPARADLIVVAPFGGSGAGESLGSSLTEEIIHALTKLEHLRVGATRQSNARWLLEGSIRREQDRLRVVAQLVDASTGVYVWSEIYEWDPAEGFTAQERIARAIAGKFAAWSRFRLPLGVAPGGPRRVRY